MRNGASDGRHRLLTRYRPEDAEAITRRVSAIVGEAELDEITRGTAAGDRAKARGVPILVEGGLSGAIAGTVPHRSGLFR